MAGPCRLVGHGDRQTTRYRKYEPGHAVGLSHIGYALYAGTEMFFDGAGLDSSTAMIALRWRRVIRVTPASSRSMVRAETPIAAPRSVGVIPAPSLSFRSSFGLMAAAMRLRL